MMLIQIRQNFAAIFFAILLSTVLLASSSSAVEKESITGVVTETMNASDYTYLLVDTGSEKVWVAIPATSINTGEKVTLAVGMDLQDFHSKTLDRTFERIIFSPGTTGSDVKASDTGSQPTSSGSSSFADAVKAEQQTPTQAQTPAAESAGSAGATVPFVDMNIEKAAGENGYTVGEIFEKAESLAGKTVKIRGKVVKVSPSIMGRNWIHIQDGTGDPMQNSHDLVATSQELPNVDDIVVVEGVLAANKDFGFGYRYDALVEKATVLK